MQKGFGKKFKALDKLLGEVKCILTRNQLKKTLRKNLHLCLLRI